MIVMHGTIALEMPMMHLPVGVERMLLAMMLLSVSELAWPDDPCPFELVDGAITEHKYSGYQGHIRISAPPQAPPAQGYPVIVYYHGWSTNLGPNVRIMHAVTGGHDYLLLGMNYRKKQFYENLDRRNLRLELKHFDQVLDELASCRPINRRAVFLAGYSQGGYAVSMIAEQRSNQIAGMILLGSARRHAKMYLEEAKQLKGLPIFIGAGELDEPHYYWATVTAQLYTLLGAEVSMETWPGTNHGQGWGWYQQDPQRRAGLKDWLDEVVAKNAQAGR